jgi:hypothetical protein
MTADVMLVIREANMPLIYAAYENHHTREIIVDGGAVYQADKVHDIAESVKVWQKHFPELTDEVIRNHVQRWITKILVPILRKACLEKMEYYDWQLENNSISTNLKEIIAGCLKKNRKYVECFDKLTADVIGNTSILYKEQAT